jgi:hypothetical protein
MTRFASPDAPEAPHRQFAGVRDSISGRNMPTTVFTAFEGL